MRIAYVPTRECLIAAFVQPNAFVLHPNPIARARSPTRLPLDDPFSAARVEAEKQRAARSQAPCDER